MKPAPQAALDALLERILKHDRDAWDRLVRDYSGFLTAIARKVFTSYGASTATHDVEDAVGDVWKNLIENDCRVIRLCLERNNFLQTLQVIARNRCVDILRRRQGAMTLNDIQPAQPTRPEPECSPEELARIVDELPQRERLLITLFFLQGKKYREIADLTGIPQNSIGPTIARALARLRKTIKD
ncbi:MAG: sigma-70 family RNA polymerase sigma factor [Planctomycetes bacterium]|nr:sigma-70 family RNA polymerase sigma factor [Planctomycetota bacterium]